MMVEAGKIPVLRISWLEVVIDCKSVRPIAEQDKVWQRVHILGQRNALILRAGCNRGSMILHGSLILPIVSV